MDFVYLDRYRLTIVDNSDLLFIDTHFYFSHLFIALIVVHRIDEYLIKYFVQSCDILDLFLYKFIIL